MKHIPNLLTVMRMILIPFIPYTYIIQDNRVASIILLLIAAFSDFLDGFIARRFNLITDVGKVLDPLADKLLLIAVVWSLFYTHNFPIGLLIAYLVIEVSMILLGALLYTRKERVVIPANIFGKIATALFFITAVLSIWFGYTSFIFALFIITLSMKSIAFASYVYHYINSFKRRA